MRSNAAFLFGPFHGTFNVLVVEPGNRHPFDQPKNLVPAATTAAEEEPYVCPACSTRLYEKCQQCGAIRPSLLPACQQCGHLLPERT